jgi:hypothetical protein
MCSVYAYWRLWTRFECTDVINLEMAASNTVWLWIKRLIKNRRRYGFGSGNEVDVWHSRDCPVHSRKILTKGENMCHELHPVMGQGFAWWTDVRRAWRDVIVTQQLWRQEPTVVSWDWRWTEELPCSDEFDPVWPAVIPPCTCKRWYSVKLSACMLSFWCHLCLSLLGLLVGTTPYTSILYLNLCLSRVPAAGNVSLSRTEGGVEKISNKRLHIIYFP